MSTDLFVLYQTDKLPSRSVWKQKAEQWFQPAEPVGEALGSGQPSLEQFRVVIGDADVSVKSRNGETVLRSYAAITTCHLCKLDISSIIPSLTALPKRHRKECLFCTLRKETYHRLAEIRVRHAIKMGYQRMHGPFNIHGTAPIPYPVFETAAGDQLEEILEDCEADLKVGRQRLEALRSQVIMRYQQMGSYEKMILVRKFGVNPFKPVSGVIRGEDGEREDNRKRGRVEEASSSSAGEADNSSPAADIINSNDSIQGRLADGERELRELRIDIGVIRKVWSQVKRMGGGGRRRLG